MIEKEITESIYKISDLVHPSDVLTNQRRIIFPYSREKGKAKPLEPAFLKSRYPEANKYLMAIRKELATRSKESEIIPYYAYGRQQGLNKVSRKILTPTFSQHPRFVEIKDESSLFCNGYGIHLRDNVSSPIAQEKYFSLVARILNSAVMHYYIKQTSVAIQGGYPCYQKNFIQNFTIPELKVAALDQLESIQDDFLFNLKLSSYYGIEVPFESDYVRSREIWNDYVFN